MKKTLYLICVLTVVLAGCQKQEEEMTTAPMTQSLTNSASTNAPTNAPPAPR